MTYQVHRSIALKSETYTGRVRLAQGKTGRGRPTMSQGERTRRRKARDRRGQKGIPAPLSHCGRRGAPKGRVDRRAVAAIQTL